MSQGAPRRLFVAIFPPKPALDHLGFVVDDLEVSRGAGAAVRLIAREGWHVTLAFLGPVAPNRVADAGSAVARAAQRWAARRGTLPQPGTPPDSPLTRSPVKESALTNSTLTDLTPTGATPTGATSTGATSTGPRPTGPPPTDSTPTGATPSGGTRREAPLNLCVAGGGTFGTGARKILWAGLAGDIIALYELAETVRADLNAAGLITDVREFRPHLTITRPGASVNPEVVTADAGRLDSYVGPLWTADVIELVVSETVPTETGPRSRYTRLNSVSL
jgi:2'-5' RNA ligase